jgi:hypothetical protein
MLRAMRRITRDLHLYAGLFLSPFILVFSLSVFFLVHGFAKRPSPDASDAPRTVAGLDIPADIAQLQGRPRVDALRSVLDQLNIRGEIDFVRHMAKERRMVVPVRLPDRDVTVELNYDQRSAMVTTRQHSLADALVYLHKMPGPHNAEVRGNSGFMRAWRVLADVTVYLFLFITLSGIYLWVALKAERRVGVILICAGALTFWGLVYAVAG